MTLELLTRLTRGAPFLPAGAHPAAHALALVPALVDALPDVALGADDRQVVFPVACGSLLSGLMEREIRASVDDVLADLRPAPPDELAQRLQSDPLTQALGRLVSEGLSLSPAAGCLVGLEFVRLCAQNLASPGPMLREGVGKILDLPPWQAGRQLGRVIAPMQARLAAVCFDLARAGIRVPALLPALAACPLAFAPPERARHLPTAAALQATQEGATVDLAGSLKAGLTAFDLVINELTSRIGSRRATPHDQVLTLRFCLAEGEGPRVALAAEPEAYALVLPQLSKWLDSTALERAGLTEAEALQILRLDVGVAVAAGVGRALRAMAAAAVLSEVLAALRPAVEATIQGRLTVPRGQPAHGTVVAVATGSLRAAMAEAIALPRDVTDAVARWRAALGAGSVSFDDGVIAWFAFADAVQALRFATSLRDRPSAGLPTPACALATGTIAGGTDGATVRMAGAVIQDAARLLAHAPLALRPHGLPESARLALVDGVLVGSGVAIDASTLEELREANVRRTPHGRPPGLAMVEAWENEDGIILVTALEGVAGGYEATRLSIPDWQALCDQQAGLAPATPETVAAAEAPTTRPPPADSTHEIRRPKRAVTHPVVVGPPAVASPDPFASDPFAVEGAGPASRPAGDPFSADPFANAGVANDPVAVKPIDELPEERERRRIGGSADGFVLPAVTSPSLGGLPPAASKKQELPEIDLQFLLAGYASYVERGRVAFGRPYGTRIVDLHAFDTAGDLDRAYVSFLEAKVAEGFIPRTDLTGDLPRGVTLMPLDHLRLAEAWRILT